MMEQLEKLLLGGSKALYLSRDNKSQGSLSPKSDARQRASRFSFSDICQQRNERQLMVENERWY